MPTTYWSPNQAAVAQVETYTFTAPNSVGNTYTATINGKSVTYTSVADDTATTVATALFNLLNATSSVPAEITEITFANPSDGVVTATAKVAGTPFANVTVNGVSGQGLVLTTGNGLSNGISTVHTTANASPSDVNDAQNWLRVVSPAPGVRSLPQNGDDVVIADSDVPLLWNLDRLVNVQFGSYVRWQSHTGQIGLDTTNENGYTEWRATHFRFVGPQGSVPAGGLSMILGQGGNNGGGPATEYYNVGSQQVTLTVLAANSVKFLGVHTANTFTLLGSATLDIAASSGEISTLSSSVVDGGATLNIGAGVTWTAGSTLTMYGGSAILNAAPATLALNDGAQASVETTGLTWATVTMRNGSNMIWLAGGTITTLTMETGSQLDKSLDARGLTITNSTIDGDTCVVNDPLNAITWTNATSVKQRVSSGPFTFTGTRTVKVT